MDKFTLIDDVELGDEALDRQAPEAAGLCRCPFSVPSEPGDDRGTELTDAELRATRPV